VFWLSIEIVIILQTQQGWNTPRNVSVVRLIVAIRSSGSPASQPVSCLTCLSADLCHLAEGAYKIRLLFVSVSVMCGTHRIVGKCIGILWRRECLLFALKTRTSQNMARRVQSCLDANCGPFQCMLWCRHISHTTNVLLFKFPCNIFIGVRIIKEMPGSVASGTFCI